MLILSMCYFFAVDTLVKVGAEYYAEKSDLTLEEAEDELTSSMYVIGVIFLAFTGLVWAIFGLGFCYRKSTKDRTYDFEEKMIMDNKREERARKESEIKDKHAKIREEMEQKYPGLKRNQY